MAERFPLIANSSANQIQEIASGDSLNLTGNNVHNAGIITATSFKGSISGGTVAGSTGTFSGDVTVSGNLGVAGTITYEDVARVDATGISTFREGFGVGPLAGIALTAYKDGSIRTSGIITANTYYGSGANLTGIDATQIVTGNTSVQTVDTGSDGHVKINTEGSERVRVGAAGSVGIGTDDPYSPLSIYGDTAPGTFINITSRTNTIAGIKFGDFDDPEIGAIKYGNGDNSLRFFANGSTEKFRVGSAGQWGIGGGNYGTSGQVLTSGGASAAPTWGSAGGITDFDEWYQSNQPAGDQDPIQTWARSSTASTKHGALGGAMSHSSGIWTFPSTGHWFISFTGWVFNQNRKNRYAQFRIQTTDNNSSYQEQAACSCRNEDDSGDGNGATYVSAHCQTIFDVTDTSLRKVKFTVDMEDNSSQTMGGRNFTSFTVIKLANT